MALSIFFRALIGWIGLRDNIAELRAMDDRLLSDIGITREQVEFAARYGSFPKH